ncbi:enhanced intracellular survival protein Eis [Pseudalkalibacillus sp. SCS-8]|uniref:GNAT family N-acetyltransferase n=1 Tax=Pseudalkalibacillus nanhaiensis TaxID=3115291 RepID=UPI0032DAC691
MEIRTINEDEFDDFLKMGEFAFQYELSEEERKKRRSFLKVENCWALYEDGAMASKLTIHPFEIWIGNRNFSMGGIAGVASWPEHRRKGHVQKLMKKSLEVMREQRQYVSMLHPFSFAFYRKYGWEMTHTTKTYEIKPEQLPIRTANMKGKVVRIHHDIQRLNAIYERYAQNYNGMLKRTEKWWNFSILENSRDIVAVYEDEAGEDQGYLIYNVKDNLMEIEEWISLTPHAKSTMLQYVANHDSMVRKIKIHPPVEESFAFYMADPKIKQEYSSYFMSRVVDVKGFLEQYPFKGDLERSLIFHIEDTFAEWNNGTFIVRSDDHGGRLVDYYPPKEGMRCSQEPQRGILCTINMFSTMFFNHMKPTELSTAGMITGKHDELSYLETILVDERPFLYDFF